jgi:glycerophosphoryl diester phosphodiesterase
VEFDLRGSADRVAVLFHDETLDRTTGSRGRVEDRTASELGALDAGGWFSRDHAGEPVPTLAQALDRLSQPGGWRGLVFPEIKGPVPRWLASATAEAVLARGMQDRTIVISLDWDAVQFIRAGFPELRVGFVVEDYQDVFEAMALCRERPGDVLDPDYQTLLERPDVAEEARREGIPLACWTVDDPHEAERLTSMGVEDLTSNEVDLLLEWRRKRPPTDPGGE